MTTSGTYAYNPALSDLMIECYERCGIRAAEITVDHVKSAVRSYNLMLAAFSNRGVNLWTVDLQSVLLIEGVSQYAVPASTVMILPGTYIRTYPMGSPVNVTPQFTTTATSTTVNVFQEANGVSIPSYIQIVIPVAVGGIVLLGYYAITSVIDSNNYTIVASSAAISSVTGGVVPVFDTAADSTSVIVTLPGHGYLAGQSFPVQVPTTVGGVTFSGDYTIASITNIDVFVITVPYAAGSTATGAENGGDAQITTQSTGAQPVDRIMSPLSRDDYAALPDKAQQGFPTTYWYDRLISPNITIWQPPDANGPYELQYYRFRRIQDAIPQDGQTLDMPFRFLEAFCSAVAFHLAMKWAADKAVALKAYADQMWGEAAAEDREYVPMYITPQFGGYFNG